MRTRLLSTSLPTFSSIAVTLVSLASAAQGALAPVHMVQPDYPDELMKEGFEGDAMLKITVTAEGAVGECEVISSDHELFGVAAKKAVQQWTFTPHEVDGQPVEKKVKIPFRFRLSEEQKVALQSEKLNALFGREVFKPLDSNIEVVRADDLPRNPRLAIPIVPIYPPELKGSGKTGEVMVKFYLDVDGKVINPEVLSSSDPAFNPNALASLIRCEYEPVKKEENPIYVEIHRSIVFREKASEGLQEEAERELNSEK